MNEPILGGNKVENWCWAVSKQASNQGSIDGWWTIGTRRNSINFVSFTLARSTELHHVSSCWVTSLQPKFWFKICKYTTPRCRISNCKIELLYVRQAQRVKVTSMHPHNRTRESFNIFKQQTKVWQHTGSYLLHLPLKACFGVCLFLVDISHWWLITRVSSILWCFPAILHYPTWLRWQPVHHVYWYHCNRYNIPRSTNTSSHSQAVSTIPTAFDFGRMVVVCHEPNRRFLCQYYSRIGSNTGCSLWRWVIDRPPSAWMIWLGTQLAIWSCFILLWVLLTNGGLLAVALPGASCLDLLV